MGAWGPGQLGARATGSMHALHRTPPPPLTPSPLPPPPPRPHAHRPRRACASPGVREHLHLIRSEFEALLAENAAKPEAERLPRSAFEIDPGLREMIAQVGRVCFRDWATECCSLCASLWRRRAVVPGEALAWVPGHAGTLACGDTCWRVRCIAWAGGAECSINRAHAPHAGNNRAHQEGEHGGGVGHGQAAAGAPEAEGVLPGARE